MLTKSNDTSSGVKSSGVAEPKEGTYGGCRYRLDYDKYEKGEAPAPEKSDRYKTLKFVVAALALLAVGYLLYQYFGEELMGCINNIYKM